jgi:hypothetical protein
MSRSGWRGLSHEEFALAVRKSRGTWGLEDSLVCSSVSGISDDTDVFSFSPSDFDAVVDDGSTAVAALRSCPDISDESVASLFKTERTALDAHRPRRFAACKRACRMLACFRVGQTATVTTGTVGKIPSPTLLNKSPSDCSHASTAPGSTRFSAASEWGSFADAEDR